MKWHVWFKPGFTNIAKTKKFSQRLGAKKRFGSWDKAQPPLYLPLGLKGRDNNPMSHIATAIFRASQWVEIISEGIFPFSIFLVSYISRVLGQDKFKKYKK